jgi:hypothetical protein
VYAAKLQEGVFKKFIGLEDEGDLARSITELRGALQVLNDLGTVSSTDLPKLLVKDKKFPSVRNLNAVFKRIGTPKMLTLVSRRTRSDVALAVTSFIDVRNALAHESPPSMTDADVDRYFKQVKSWINAIDRELFSHVYRSSGAVYWNGAPAT